MALLMFVFMGTFPLTGAALDPNTAIIRIMPDGTFFGTDSKNAVHWDAQGHRLRDVGGIGGGPGELYSVATGMWDGTHYWLSDAYRVNYFDKSGNFLYSESHNSRYLDLIRPGLVVTTRLVDGQGNMAVIDRYRIEDGRIVHHLGPGFAMARSVEARTQMSWKIVYACAIDADTLGFIRQLTPDFAVMKNGRESAARSLRLKYWVPIGDLDVGKTSAAHWWHGFSRNNWLGAEGTSIYVGYLTPQNGPDLKLAENPNKRELHQRLAVVRWPELKEVANLAIPGRLIGVRKGMVLSWILTDEGVLHVVHTPLPPLEP